MKALSTKSNMTEIAKSWRTAVVVIRSVDTIWWELKDMIGSKVVRLVEVVSMTADRVVIWCKDEAKRNKLLTKKTLFCKKNPVGRMEPWSMYSH